jgi:hypothetical protein
MKTLVQVSIDKKFERVHTIQGSIFSGSLLNACEEIDDPLDLMGMLLIRFCCY